VGNLTTITDPLGHTTRRIYDAASRLTQQTDSRGMPTSVAYNALNQTTEIRDPLGGLTRMSYDGNGNLVTVTDARNNTTAHSYDSMDRLQTRTDPVNATESFEYDGLGNLTRHTDRKGQVATFSYDGLNRRTGASYADGSATTLAYDAGGRLTGASDSAGGALLNGYDLLDRLLAQTTALGTVRYQYDALGRRTQLDAPNQASVGYGYDAASRVRTITQGPLGPVTLDYDALGRRTRLSLPNGVATEHQYDAASRLTALLYRNAAGQLGDLTYQYDSAGNRTGVGGAFSRTLVPTAVPAASYDAANRQLGFGSQTLSYDPNGNLTSDGVNLYTWNARNQLVAITGPGATVTFSYDALGRRQSRTVNGASTQVLYDGLTPIQEAGSTGIAILLTGAGIDEYLTRTDAAGPRTLVTDALGSTVALTDAAGAVQTQYTYEPFGATAVTGPTDANAFQYTGRENDGTGLYYYRARYYHPTLSRFIGEDPIGLRGGINVYAYVQNRPLYWIDPLGLDVTISLYKCCLGFNHIGIGINADSPFYTVGFYPKTPHSFVDPGVVLPDSLRNGENELIDSITLRTSSEQDRAIEDFINSATRQPGRYNVTAIGGRHCGAFVQDALAAAGISPIGSVGSPVSVFKALKALQNAGVDFSGGVSPASGGGAGLP